MKLPKTIPFHAFSLTRPLGLADSHTAIAAAASNAIGQPGPVPAPSTNLTAVGYSLPDDSLAPPTLAGCYQDNDRFAAIGFSAWSRKIPAKLLEAKLHARIDEEKLARGIPYVNKATRKEIKEGLVEALVPLMPPCPSTVPVWFCPVGDRFFLLTSSLSKRDAALNAFASLLRNRINTDSAPVGVGGIDPLGIAKATPGCDMKAIAESVGTFDPDVWGSAFLRFCWLAARAGEDVLRSAGFDVPGLAFGVSGPLSLKSPDGDRSDWKSLRAPELRSALRLATPESRVLRLVLRFASGTGTVCPDLSVRGWEPHPDFSERLSERLKDPSPEAVRLGTLEAWQRDLERLFAAWALMRADPASASAVEDAIAYHE